MRSFLLTFSFAFIFLHLNAFRRPPTPEELPNAPSCSLYIHASGFDKSPSVNAFLQVVDLLAKEHHSDDNLDRDVSARLRPVDPMAAGMMAASTDLWDFVFNRCVITNTMDTPLIRIYRLGLIKSARTLYGKSFFDRSRYMLARAIDGKNIMHFAVMSRNPDLVQHVAFILKEDVISQVEQKDKSGESPIDIAYKLGYDGVGVVEMLRKIYGVYKGAQLPTPKIAQIEREIEKPEPGVYHDPAAAAMDLGIHAREVSSEVEASPKTERSEQSFEQPSPKAPDYGILSSMRKQDTQPITSHIYGEEPKQSRRIGGQPGQQISHRPIRSTHRKV